ncbi:hypothetical protein [Paenibacillus sp. S-12]|uniref:hypothetical protein n=1 Tax=Paenibacillus sp. S-12 TaxID=3031371 RepID=UPI00338EA530
MNGKAPACELSAARYLPVETTNYFAREMNIPRNWREGCDLIIEQKARPIDLELAGGRYFINIACCESLTELS